MSNDIQWIVPDRLVEVIFSGDLLLEDLMVLNRLDLDKRTRPIYILVNDYHIRLGVPEGALNVLDKTQGAHPMIKHVAFCGAPAVMEIFTKLLVKMLRLKGKVTFHPIREQALAKLEELMAQEGASRDSEVQTSSEVRNQTS